MDVYDSTGLYIKNSKISKIVRNRNMKLFLTTLIVALFSVPIIINSINYHRIDWVGILIALFLLGCAFYGFYLIYSRTVNIFNYRALQLCASIMKSRLCARLCVSVPLWFNRHQSK